jgi:3-isopropylmalate dehydrogenase
MTGRILLLPGDGIGPEVAAAAMSVLAAVAKRFGHTFHTEEHAIGGAALRAGLPPLPDETLAAAQESDAVFLGAVGDPTFDHHPPGQRPESALLAMRKALGLFANLRPARVWPGLENAGPVKATVLSGTDLLVVRELTGGLYYGEPRGISADGTEAVNTLRYSVDEITRVTRVACDLARRRKGRVVSVDKANVLEVSQLWRRTVNAVARDYPDVQVTHEYVDAAAMKLALAPSSFDVLLTENLFGDVLSDEAGAVCGSLGLLPSASIGARIGLFEPVHGSAPGIAGQNIANPVGAIASMAMLLEHSFGLNDEAGAITRALERTLASGIRTTDVAEPGIQAATTTTFTDAVVTSLHRD